MVFDTEIPVGFRKGNGGWSLKVPSSKDKKLTTLKSENADLKSRLEQLEAAVAEMASNEKKK